MYPPGMGCWTAACLLTVGTTQHAEKIAQALLRSLAQMTIQILWMMTKRLPVEKRAVAVE